MPLPLFVVDAFADRPFAGNPAGVCLLDSEKPAEWMQAVAAEMKHAETAFVLRRGEGGDGGYGLRWFTPEVEVDLCGHATLASAHALWEAGMLGKGDEARFFTRSGWLTCARAGEWIRMDFPAVAVEERRAPERLIEALGLKEEPEFVGGGMDWLVRVKEAGEVRRLRPDFAKLARIETRGVIVTAKADAEVDGAGVDFVSRFFAPRVGIAEDPVTGSAHCALGPYWGRVLGKEKLTARQVSARGGTVRMELKGERVMLFGQAVTVVRGELLA